MKKRVGRPLRIAAHLHTRVCDNGRYAVDVYDGRGGFKETKYFESLKLARKAMRAVQSVLRGYEAPKCSVWALIGK